MTGVCMIISQLISPADYLTGRLRIRWHDLRTYEVFFRDPAKRFIIWALATVVTTEVGILAAKAGVPVFVTATTEVAAEAARKAAAGFAVFNAIGMLVAAFIACVAAAIGGKQRAEHA